MRNRKLWIIALAIFAVSFVAGWFILKDVYASELEKWFTIAIVGIFPAFTVVLAVWLIRAPIKSFTD